MTALVSIIIPVYNVAAYLDQCVHSVVQQTYPDLEILLVDDGATDTSGIQCDAWAKKDTRIKVFHRENHGLSVSRNFGIQQATGAFCLFLDSDDYLRPETIAETVAQMKGSVDLVFYDRTVLTADGHLTWLYHHRFAGRYTPSEMLTGLLTEQFKHYATGYLFRLKLWTDQKIQFPPQQNFEDVATTYRLILAARQIYYLPKALYIYRIRSGAITAAMDTTDRLALLKSTLSFLAGIKAYYPDQKKLAAYFLNVLVYLSRNAHDAYQQQRLSKKQLQQELDQYQNHFEMTLQDYDRRQFGKARLTAALIRWHLYPTGRKLWLRLKDHING